MPPITRKHAREAPKVETSKGRKKRGYIDLAKPDLDDGEPIYLRRPDKKGLKIVDLTKQEHKDAKRSCIDLTKPRPSTSKTSVDLTKEKFKSPKPRPAQSESPIPKSLKGATSKAKPTEEKAKDDKPRKKLSAPKPTKITPAKPPKTSEPPSTLPTLGLTWEKWEDLESE